MNGPMTFRIVIDDKREYTLELDKMLAVTEPLLDQQLSDQPSQYAWVATLASLARSKRMRMEMDLEVEEARLGQELREKAASAGEKITEKALGDYLTTHKRLLGMRRELIQAEEQEGVCDAAKEAFRHRKDCLITVAANYRAEADNRLTVGRKA